MWNILIVEDEGLLAYDVATIVEDLLATKAAVARDIASTVKQLEVRPDFVFLNVLLNGEDTYEIARELCHRSVPFVFVTAVQKERIPPDLQSVPLIAKPFSRRTVAGALLSGLEAMRRRA